MKIIRTMKYKIKGNDSNLRKTLSIYRDAISFLVQIYDKEWDSVSMLQGKEKQNVAEKLIHKTKDNPKPKYDFGEKFYKFPSYLRRSAITESLGIISSYRSNLVNWEEAKERSNKENIPFKSLPPRLSDAPMTFPVFYKGNMSRRVAEDQIEIKVWNGLDWIWEGTKLPKKYKGIEKYKELNPSLIKKKNKFFLHIPYETKEVFREQKIENRIIISVDLGLTHSAVCAAMKSNGTVIGRKFINQPIEKDRLMSRLGRLKKAQVNSCKNSKNKLPNHWRKINNLNKEIAQNTANEIVDFAIEMNATVIVFEYLGDFKKPKGSWFKKQRARLQHWMHKRVVEMAGRKAHRNGIRYRRVSAVNTSKLAFDGSGQVKRNDKKDIAVFKTGKTYNADLNASYNIGARYYIREILKTLPVKARLRVETKVSQLAFRTKCTLDTLIRLCEEMCKS